ncbi:MAG: hypothetical protein WC790_01455 [Candidatus Paceibacterota bacterium]|jgi:hypothetical protein
MKEQAAIMGAVAIAVVGALWMVNVRTVQAPGQTACTMEAKICPDGTAVGRTGPNCEFAACPTSGPITLEARIGQEVSGLGVRIIPTELLEDSRCPVDVVCIQAGTVRVRARLISGLGEANQEFKLNQPITTETEEVTLIQVMPQPLAGVETKDSSYVFRFEVSKRK